MQTIVEVNVSELEALIGQMPRMKTVMLGRLGERGYQLLRAEVPKVTTNLQQGVAPAEIKGDTATLTVTARSARRGPRSATVHLPSGKTKQITLRATEAYNYARVVALGYQQKIRPKTARALLVPVAVVPAGETYIESEGRYFVVRRFAQGRKANPYHDRAAKRLSGEAVQIARASIEKVIDGK